MADDVAKVSARADAELLFFAEREQAEDTIDGLAGVDRVKRAEHQVARFRRHERDFHRGAIAHFADENDLGRLAQGGAQAVGIIVEIVTRVRAG